ncbi:MAG TPA: hypothetical protein VN622_10010 [Clostridia bacterium]|nr:hypothetical protein [Clostridia bacterium]
MLRRLTLGVPILACVLLAFVLVCPATATPTAVVKIKQPGVMRLLVATVLRPAILPEPFALAFGTPVPTMRRERLLEMTCTLLC